MENEKAALAALMRKWCEEKDNAVRMESRMKTVIAIDSFKGSMTSMEAGNAAAAGVKAVFPDAEIVVRYFPKKNAIRYIQRPTALGN